MTKDELWLFAVKRVLGHTADGYDQKLIQGLLDDAGDDVSLALRLMTRRGEYGYSAAVSLGNFGSCGPNYPRVDCLGSAGQHPILAWLPGQDYFDGRLPDLVIQWREIFQYVKDGCVRTVQTTLFDYKEVA